MEKNSLEKLKNLMLKKYRKEISFRQLQKEFLKNDNERIEYIKTEFIYEKKEIRFIQYQIAVQLLNMTILIFLLNLI